MKTRVTYRADGGVSTTSIEGMTAKQVSEWYTKLLSNPLYEGSSFEDIDSSELPVDRVDRDKWRKKAGGGVFIDKTVVTRTELIQADETALDTELAKPNPNMKKAMLLQRKLDKYRSGV